MTHSPSVMLQSCSRRLVAAGLQNRKVQLCLMSSGELRAASHIHPWQFYVDNPVLMLLQGIGWVVTHEEELSEFLSMSVLLSQPARSPGHAACRDSYLATLDFVEALCETSSNLTRFPPVSGNVGCTRRCRECRIVCMLTSSNNVMPSIGPAHPLVHLHVQQGKPAEL
jgi:hypothetical protein